MIFIWMDHNSKLSEWSVHVLFSLFNEAWNEYFFSDEKYFKHVVNLRVLIFLTGLLNPNICLFLSFDTGGENVSHVRIFLLNVRRVLLKEFSLSFSSLFELKFFFFFSLVVEFSLHRFSANTTPYMIWIPMRTYFELMSKSASKFNVSFLKDLWIDLSTILIRFFKNSEVKIVTFDAPYVFSIEFGGLSKFNKSVKFVKTGCELMLISTLESKSFTTSTTFWKISCKQLSFK